MLRTITRPVVGSIRLVSRSRVRETSSAMPAIESQTIVRLKARVGPWMIAQAPLMSKAFRAPIQQQRRLRLMSSMTRNIALGHSKERGAKRRRGEEGLTVAPVLVGGEKLPSNLKLAVETWPGKEDEVDDFEGDDPDSLSEENFEDCDEDTESLSEEDQHSIESLVGTPSFFYSSKDTEVRIISWEDGTPVGTRSLDPSVFGAPLRRDVVHDVVRWQLAKRRSGTAKTKRIGDIRGSGRKVRPQKGQGRARAGHSRPPHWRGGAKAHGPTQRDFSFKLNKKYVKLGLRVALSARLREGQLTVVDDLRCDNFSTSAMVNTLKARGIPNDVTFIVGGDPQPEFERSIRNIVGTKVLAARRANLYDIIKRPSLVLTEDAVSRLEDVLETR